MAFAYTVLFFVFHFCISDAAKECSQTNIPSFTIDDYTLLQSPNFPQTLYSNATSSTCNVNLIAKNTNYYLWIAILNGAAPRLIVRGYPNSTSEYDYDSNKVEYLIFDILKNNVTFTASSKTSIQPWSAFQAAVISYDPLTATSTCPLAQSDNEIFDFIAFPDLIIPLTSDYGKEGEQNKKNCKWNFNISPSEQQLKVVVTHLKLFLNSSLTLFVDLNLIYNFTKSTPMDYPMYFNGSVFSFIFTNNETTLTNHNFYATVSAVKLTTSSTSNGCQMFQSNSSTTVFTNIDYINGYPPFQYCNHTINIPTNHEAIIGLYETNFEACCDSVSLVYYNNSQNTRYKWQQNDLGNKLSLKTGASGSHVTFTSDGNVQEAGYKALLNTFECVCGRTNYFVECNKSIRITPLENNMYYCDNMNCTYQIYSHCSNQYFNFDPYLDEFREGTDQIVLLKNGKIIKNFTYDNYGEYEVIMHNDNFSIIFQSGISQSNVVQAKLWYIDIIPIYPIFSKVMLDAGTPSHAIRIVDISKENVAYTVCARTGSLEMFIVAPRDASYGFLHNFYLYDDDGLDGFVGSLPSSFPSFSDELLRNRRSMSGCFTVYNSANYEYRYLSNFTILYKAIDESVRNCENNLTVFQVPTPASTSYNVFIRSTNAGPCKASFLTALTFHGFFPFIWIYEMNTTSTQNLVFISEINNKKFLEINPNEINLWRDVMIFTSAISVIVPSSSYLSIEFSNPANEIDIHGDQQKGILASPSYFGILDTFSNFEYPELLSHYTDIFVKELYGSPDAVIQAYINSTAVNATLYLGESKRLDFFHLFYNEKDPSKNGFLIEYTSYQNEPTTTTAPTSSTTITTRKTVSPNTTQIATTTPTTTKAATSSISVTSSSSSVLLTTQSNTTMTLPSTPAKTSLITTMTPTTPDSTTKMYDSSSTSVTVTCSFLLFYTVLVYGFFL